MPKRAVILAHGIHTTKKEAEAWAAGLEPRLRENNPDIAAVLLWEYGWTSAFAVRFPWVGGAVRRHLVGRFQGWVAQQLHELEEEHGRAVVLDAVGYSMGSYLVGRSMTDAPGPRAFFDRVVLMGSILSSRDDWSSRFGHYTQALNLFSSEDDVVKMSTFGQSGWRGFTKQPREVTNFECLGYEHGDYERPGPAWTAAANFLRTGIPFV
jgi:hypothetical protein